MPKKIIKIKDMPKGAELFESKGLNTFIIKELLSYIGCTKAYNGICAIKNGDVFDIYAFKGEPNPETRTHFIGTWSE